MDYTTYNKQISNRPNALDYQAGDGGGAQEEPYMSVWSAHVRSGNPQTGNGLTGLAVPASVNEAPSYVPLEAEDAPNPGRGSIGDELDLLWSLNIGVEDDSEDSQEEISDDEDQLMLSSDEDEPPRATPQRQNRLNNNAPKKIPGFKIVSLNMRGRQKDNKDKLKMVIDWMRTNKISIMALQETHLMEETILDLNKRYRNLRFFGSGLSTSSAGVMFVVNDAEVSQPTSFETFEKGRTAMLTLDHGGQELNIVNVYLPNHKTQQKEFLTRLTRDLEGQQNLIDTNLLILGDWNFVEDRTDRSPQHDDDKRVTHEMTKLKASFDLIDGWRTTNPEQRKFSWEGTTGNER